MLRRNHVLTAVAAAMLTAAPTYAQTAQERADIENRAAARMDAARAKFLEGMKPVCRDRAADLKAGRRPKRFNAFLLSLPAEIRPEVVLACKSM